MKFVKIKTPEKVLEGWYLIIHNVEELEKYLQVDAKGFTQALFSMRKDPDANGTNVRTDHLFTHRERVLAVTIEHDIETAEAGKQVWPHEVISNIIQKKGMAMHKAVTTAGPIQINESGGWSEHKIFLSIHNAEVYESVEKDGVTYPQDKPPIHTNVLVLENAPHMDKAFRNKLAAIFPSNSFFEGIYDLKEKDADWVYKSIVACPAIAMQTQTVDLLQLNKMMELFNHIPTSKRIIVDTSNKAPILTHRLYEANNNKHTIEFI